MLPTLFITYRQVPGLSPGLNRVVDKRVVVYCAGLTDETKEEDVPGAVLGIRKAITTELHLPAFPRAVVYLGKKGGEDMKSMVRELLPREGTRILACVCGFQEKQVFAMGYGFQITPCECDGGGPTMARLINEAVTQFRT